MQLANKRDEIDLIVDDILSRPDRAEELKKRLRDRLHPKRTGASFIRIVSDNDDPDSMWDNMPV